MNIDEIDQLLTIDFANDREFLHLTPNENVVSQTAKRYVTEGLSDRYPFGPGYEGEKFMLFGGFTALAREGLTDLTAKTEQLVNEMTGSTNVLFAPLSGLHSMMMCVLTTSKVGQTVFCLDPDYGGHFATMDVIRGTGRAVKTIPFNKQTLDIDYEQFEQLAHAEQKPFSVYIDASYSLIPFDIARLRKIIGQEILIYDASHTMGLILGGQFPNPLTEGADMITANTHKTLPGSHKGMILFANTQIAAKVSGPAHAFYSSTHNDHTITLCVTLAEMAKYGRQYAADIVANANLLGDLLAQKGLVCRKADDTKWTYTHQLHLMTKDLGSTEDLAKRFFGNNMDVAFDVMFEQGAFIRIGLQEFTRRGAGEAEIEELANTISDAIKGSDVRDRVKALNAKLNQVHYSFDTK